MKKSGWILLGIVCALMAIKGWFVIDKMYPGRGNATVADALFFALAIAAFLGLFVYSLSKGLSKKTTV
jgi:hypothetical protein